MLAKSFGGAWVAQGNLQADIPEDEILGQMRQERDRFVAFAFTGSDLLVECAASGKIVFMSGATAALGIEAPSDFVGQSIKELVDQKDHLFIESLFENAWRTGRVRPVAIRLNKNSGKPLRSVLRCMRYGNLLYVGFNLTPVSHGSEVSDEDLDDATGLMLKDSFVDRAIQQVEQMSAIPGKSQKARLTLMEVDGLSALENQEVADEINASLGALLRSWSNGGDSAGAVGEDRFGVVSDNNVDMAQLESLMEKFSQKTGTDLSFKAVEVSLDTQNMTNEDATRALMYAINSYATVNDVSEYSVTSLEKGAQEYLMSAWERVSRIRDLLEKRNFVMAFQPIVNLETGELHHFESLMRIQGSESPYDMVTFAEKVGMILDFDMMVATQLITMLEEARLKGNTPHIAMNVSARSLQSSLFVQSFRDMMKQSSHLIPQISLEITETSQVGELYGFNSVIQDLRKDGHEMALDDVGAGTTSFETLRHLDVDFAKIDGQYIRRASQNEKDLAVLKSVVDVCKAMNLHLIAEMIETSDQVAHMQSLGVEYGQGYYYGKPIKGQPGLIYPQPDPSDTKSLGKRVGAVDQFG